MATITLYCRTFPRSRTAFDIETIIVREGMNTSQENLYMGQDRRRG